MLTTVKKKLLRSKIFIHLDGLVCVPTCAVLHEVGVTEFILKNKQINVTQLSEEFKANEGYLNVALHVLSSQGWLKQEISDDGSQCNYTLTENGEFAFPYFHLYKEANELLRFTEKFHPRRFEVEPFRFWEKIANEHKNSYGLDTKTVGDINVSRILDHIEGVLAGPSIVHLAMNGMFHKYFMEASFKAEEFHRHPECFEVLLDFFTDLGWFEKTNDTYRFTDKGIFFAKRAGAYGVTVSYIPTLRNLKELIFGDPNCLRQEQPGETERHVDREMNVWGSGSAHTAYFEEVDRILIDIFNQPIENQPKGLLDMGCGNAAFLIHAFDVIERQTLRGKHLEDQPLILVGADFNKEALRVSRANTIQADVWAKFIQADISRPDLLAQQLQKDYQIDLSDLLNFRSFIDHNHIWQYPEKTYHFNTPVSTGAFAYRGKRINNRDVEGSLYEHLNRWIPYISRHGLLVIELHTVPPEMTAKNLGNIAATAYAATHGYSDQYIIEFNHFKTIAKACGLQTDDNHVKNYPNEELTTISIQLFKPAGHVSK